MSHFLLPRTLSNSIVEEITDPIVENEYVKMFEHGQIYSISLHDLIPLYSIQEGRTLITGEEPSGLYSIILDTTESCTLDILNHQEPNGCYLSKLSNTTQPSSIQYLYKLACCYKKVYLCKPDHDCQTSSTKYVIAMHYLHSPEKGNLKIPYYFRMKLEDIHSILGQIQLEHLRFKGTLGKNINLSYGS